MDDQTVQVYKFGGSSVKNAKGYHNVANIIKRYNKSSLVVVLSAMGKTTNALEEVVDLLFSEERKKAEKRLKELIAMHEDVVVNLGLGKKVKEKILDIFVNCKDKFESYLLFPFDKAYDHIVCVGELASTTILTALLEHEGLKVKWFDARKIVATNDIHRDATVDWVKTRQQVDSYINPVFESGNVAITQGYIGGYENITTTLGKEGSDYTAAILSFVLDADNLVIWKDVPGILTGDPREFENVIKIDRLSYQEATEMTYYGAKVIHPKTIKPLQNKGIKLYVRPFNDLDEEGTLITHSVEVSYPPIVVIEKNQCLLHISTKDFSFVAVHHMSFIFNMISKHRIKVNMMRNTAISFTVCVTDKGQRVQDLIADLSNGFNVVCDTNLELITLRHYQEQGMKELIGERIIIFEERIKDTIQIVVRQSPSMRRK